MVYAPSAAQQTCLLARLLLRRNDFAGPAAARRRRDSWSASRPLVNCSLSVGLSCRSTADGGAICADNLPCAPKIRLSPTTLHLRPQDSMASRWLAGQFSRFNDRHRRAVTHHHARRQRQQLRLCASSGALRAAKGGHTSIPAGPAA